MKSAELLGLELVRGAEREAQLFSGCFFFIAEILLMEEIRRSPVEVGSLSHCLKGFIQPKWCKGFLPSTLALATAFFFCGVCFFSPLLSSVSNVEILFFFGFELVDMMLKWLEGIFTMHVHPGKLTCPVKKGLLKLHLPTIDFQGTWYLACFFF